MAKLPTRIGDILLFCVAALMAIIGGYHVFNWLGMGGRHLVRVLKLPGHVETLDKMRLKQINDIHQHSAANFTFVMDRVEALELEWKAHQKNQAAGDARQDARIAALEPGVTVGHPTNIMLLPTLPINEADVIYWDGENKRWVTNNPVGGPK